MKHRILFVNHASVLGGAELSLIDLATAYRSTSEVVLFSHGPLEERLREQSVNVSVLQASKHLLDIKTSSHFSTLRSIPDLLRLAHQISQKAKTGFDVLHINSQKALIVTAIASVMGDLPPLVWHLRDILTANHFSPINRKIAVTLANHCVTKVIANSRATASAFVKAGGHSDRVEVVYNGISPQPFATLQPPQNQHLRQSLNLGDAGVIGVFSRLSFWKGQHVVLEAMKHLPDVHVLLVGDALFGETDYVEYLRSLVNELNLHDRVHWLGFRKDIPALMQICDFVVHPSTQPEPFGRVLVEGLLAQRPVIGTAAGGALEIIQDGVTGRLFPPNDVDCLVKIIQELQANPDAARSLAQRGYHHAQQTFSLEALLHNFTSQIDSIVATHPTHSSTVAQT